MIRPRKYRLRRIGLIMVTASVVLFAVSVYLLSASTSEYTLNSDPGSVLSFHQTGVQAGNDLTYKISFHQTVNITAALIAPDGTNDSVITYTTLPTNGNTLLATASGNWTLKVINNGRYTVNVSITLGSQPHYNILIQPGNYTSFYDSSVQVNNNVVYSIDSNQISRVAASLISPGGTVHSSVNLTNGTTGYDTIIAPSSGNWSLVVMNEGQLPVNLTVSIGDVSYVTLGLAIFGFVLLPAGIALVAIYTYSVRMEKKRHRLREFSE